jgi:uncharacterized protein YyaL (SSP411 family)
MAKLEHAANEAKTAKANRLLNESSTYLQQHALNPVDWYPWTQEALDKAKKENKPILLSIGYAACHWCHVMAHESFEDEQTASLMNEHFVNIKVDREERTDLDEIYMKAVQMMTGHGGWPMTVFLTPQLKPFYGGTYFPPTDRHGLPAFKSLLKALSVAWTEQNADITQSADELTEHIKALDKITQKQTGEDLVNGDTVGLACAKLLESFDKVWGGFGNAPKFPHTMTLSLFMRHLQANPDSAMFNQCRQLVETSLNRMAYGGMHDQIGGGFARYSVDRQWLIPHFEKMLYDNALLAKVYLEGYQLFGRDYWKRVATGIFDFVLNELSTADGAFYSSLDADSEGEEGKFYVWSEKELQNCLTADEFAFVIKTFGITANGNFEHNTNALHLPDGPEKAAASSNLSIDEFWSKLAPISSKLLKIRNQRIHPGLDEKVLTSWNSLMISAFVTGYKVIGERKYFEVAKTAAQFILDNLYKDGSLLRTWGKGQAKLAGCLDDYTYFIDALCELSSVDNNPQWLATAVSLADVMIAQFWDQSGNGIYFTPHIYEELLTRTRSYTDGAIPSGTSTAAFVLEKLARITGKKEYAEKAKFLIDLYALPARTYPDQFSNLLCAMDFGLSKPREIVILQDSSRAQNELTAERDACNKVINQTFSPNKTVIFDTFNSENSESNLNTVLLKQNSLSSPLLESRAATGQPLAIYICENFACKNPIFSMEEFGAQMQADNQS